MGPSSTELTVADYLAELATIAGSEAIDRPRAALVAAVASAAGAELDPVLADAFDAELAAPSPPPGLEAAELIGLSVQVATGEAVRHAEGMYFTPHDVAVALVAESFDASGPPATVADLCCGGGSFLLAAARWFESQGVDRASAVARLRGVDLDPLAAAAARTSLAHWADVEPESVAVVQGDGFTAAKALGPELAGPFGAVVGNPPFQSQLGEATARTAAQTEALRSRFGKLVRPYVDTAALFLLDALDQVVPGGTIALVLPQSVLATRDCEPIRVAVSERAAMRAIWFADDANFDAAVRVCALVLDTITHDVPTSATAAVRSLGGAVPTYVGEFAAPEAPSRWAEFNADRQGVPRVAVAVGSPTLATLASATAGFRDEYYALAEAAVEGAADDSRPQLITSGLVEVLESRWGVDQARFAKQRWWFPTVDQERLGGPDDRAVRWVQQRLVPKVLLATQTKVLEVVADPDGRLVPITPVISVEVHDPNMVWHVAAALTAPATALLAFRRTAGAALAASAIKLSARQALDLPLPADRGAWDEGAEQAKSLAEALVARQDGNRDAVKDQLVELGRTMNRAYEIHDPAVLAWWSGRLRTSV